MRGFWRIALSIAAFPAIAAEPAFTDPWDAQTIRAAEAAVSRLGPKRALDIRSVVLTINGLTQGFGAGSSSIIASVQQVKQAMVDLHGQDLGLQIRIELPADVLFDFDKADIRSDAQKALQQLGTVIKGYPKGSAMLIGHTDSKGDDTYNQTLSERRAESVKQWLITREQVEGGRLKTSGEGEKRPAADNNTDAGRQKNRRLEAIINKQ